MWFSCSVHGVLDALTNFNLLFLKEAISILQDGTWDQYIILILKRE